MTADCVFVAGMLVGAPFVLAVFLGAHWFGNQVRDWMEARWPYSRRARRWAWFVGHFFGLIVNIILCIVMLTVIIPMIRQKAREAEERRKRQETLLPHPSSSLPVRVSPR